MSTKTSSELEADATAQKRAQWEQFSFDVGAPGLIEVTNESHENPAEHQYSVSIDDATEELVACTCPHHVHRNAYCKHMAAVETATDDGTLEASPPRTTKTMLNRTTVTATVSVISRVGRACERDGRNCRTNHRFSSLYPWHAQ
ncbi:SWIM zinc finger family protein [Haladaptatus sp. DFWS20]|uniref:SWIM zinc finger family protein n=1 Tax=Haladaptatus sp. DFWS20 TaxID=3403467 RepID=UPI003EBDECE8